MMPTPHPDPQPGCGRQQHGRHARRVHQPYGRSDAIADGLLIEVPVRLSRQFHFTYPVALTAQAWFDTVLWDERAEQGKPTPTGQHECSRITEVLWAARQAQYISRTCSSALNFLVHRVPPTGPETRSLRITLRIAVHAGDCGEAVATISHAHPAEDAAAWFVSPGGPRFPAVAVDSDNSGRSHPVVTVDTLDVILAAASGDGVDATPGAEGTVHVHQQDGITVTLWPDAHGHYPLRRLDWPFEQAPS